LKSQQRSYYKNLSKNQISNPKKSQSQQNI